MRLILDSFTIFEEKFAAKTSDYFCVNTQGLSFVESEKIHMENEFPKNNPFYTVDLSLISNSNSFEKFAQQFA